MTPCGVIDAADALLGLGEASAEPGRNDAKRLRPETPVVNDAVTEIPVAKRSFGGDSAKATIVPNLLDPRLPAPFPMPQYFNGPRGGTYFMPQPTPYWGAPRHVTHYSS